MSSTSHSFPADPDAEKTHVELPKGYVKVTTYRPKPGLLRYRLEDGPLEEAIISISTDPKGQILVYFHNFFDIPASISDLNQWSTRYGVAKVVCL